MTNQTSGKLARSPAAVGRWCSLVGTLVLALACGEAPPAAPFVVTGGSGGSSGFGGVVGAGATTGAGGTAAAGGSGGAGGTGGSGAGAGAGGTPGPCATNALCHTCPDRFLCDSDDDCAFSGYVCVASGCETHEGAPIKQCQPSRGGSCVDSDDCPNTTDYECMPVGGTPRCVRVTPGCSPATEAYDCVPGFSCQGGECVDRRVPCNDYGDCPKSHVCSTTPTASFCVRVHRTCHADQDCAGFGSVCHDIDGDGDDECAGELGGDVCVNSDCTDSAAPVCEVGVTGTTAVCGDYGLCQSIDDCDDGFECVGLWQDGRKECVRVGGTCDRVTDCPVRQVCAAPRAGGPPSCQRGIAP